MKLKTVNQDFVYIDWLPNEYFYRANEETFCVAVE